MLLSGTEYILLPVPLTITDCIISQLGLDVQNHYTL